jgi:uncharacterized membrane protein YagU involved in acid resistance
MQSLSLLLFRYYFYFYAGNDKVWMDIRHFIFNISKLDTGMRKWMPLRLKGGTIFDTAFYRNWRRIFGHL